MFASRHSREGSAYRLTWPRWPRSGAWNAGRTVLALGIDTPDRRCCVAGHFNSALSGRYAFRFKQTFRGHRRIV